MATNPVLNDRRFEQVIAEGYSDTRQERTMTLGGTLSALSVLFVLLIASAIFGWMQVKQVQAPVFSNGVPVIDEAGNQVMGNATSFPSWIIFPALGAFVLVLVTAFKPMIAMFTSPIYAVGMGMFLGAISAVYNYSWDGIVVQAVIATLSVVGVVLFLYATRIVKVTPKFVLITIGATFGIAIMYLVGMVASWLGADIMFWNEPSLFGIGISVVICIVASMNLFVDFAFIEQSVAAKNMPRRMEWFAALGETITIVWLYLELLRLLSLLRQQ